MPDAKPRLFNFDPETGILGVTVYLSPLFDPESRTTLQINVKTWTGNPIIVGRSKSVHGSYLRIWSDGSIRVYTPSQDILDMGKSHLTFELTDDPLQTQTLMDCCLILVDSGSGRGLALAAPRVFLEPDAARGFGIFLRGSAFDRQSGEIPSGGPTIMPGANGLLPLAEYEGALRLVLTPENEQTRDFLQYFGGDENRENT